MANCALILKISPAMLAFAANSILCRLALLTAAYFVLSITLTVKTPYLEITFKSLPVVVGALHYRCGVR